LVGAMIMDFVVRLFLALLFLACRAHLYTFTKLMGYRRFEPDPNSVLVTCCTNGLGHVHQMERVLSVLQHAGMEFPVVVLAKEQKVPAYKLESLKSRFPDATFYNLNFEVDYDNGKSFDNMHIIASAVKMGVRRLTPFYRKVSRIMRRHRPAYCLSFWEPGVASFINVMNCPTRLVSVASQGQIYADTTGVEKGFFLQALKWFNVGDRGTLVPLSVRPLDDAIPQVVRVPTPAPMEEREDYFVAYSTVPQVMGAIGKRMVGHRVRLFVKERRLAFYTAKYRKYPHVEVRVTAPDFVDQLARSKGLIASPSRGVVTQALALGRPVYLFCPKGHLEQEYNLRFYMKRFAGVACPKSWRYRRFFGARRSGRGRNATVSAPSEYRGRLQTLLEWQASLDAPEMAEAMEVQSAELRDWLGKTDDRIVSQLVPLLSPTAEDLAKRHEEEAKEKEEDERERAEVAAELSTPEEVEEDSADEEEEDDDDPEVEGEAEAANGSAEDAARSDGDTDASSIKRVPTEDRQPSQADAVPLTAPTADLPAAAASA